jgi:protein-tyrosine-phosphatase
MNAINLILTVCAVSSPTTCEERNLVFSSDFSLRQCVMAAQPYMAQWIAEHPQWTIKEYHCDYPGRKVEDWGIEDPSGKPVAEVRRIRDLLRTHVEELVRRLQSKSTERARSQ